MAPPFEISPLTAGPQFGLIGICACPGRAYHDLLSHSLLRDLDADLRAIRDFGAVTLVTLMEHGEMDWAGTALAGFAESVAAFGMNWRHLPIADSAIPDSDWHRSWYEVVPGLLQSLREQRNIVVHCRGGRGRAGLVAARLLIELGENSTVAIARVRAARPGAIENRAQENYLHGLGAGSLLNPL